MVLSGTLREFILADVMQLLTQQKVTGRLVINSGCLEGTILFKNGIIVGATRHTETFTNRLFYYLITVQQQPRNKIRELFSSYDGKTAELTALLESKGVFTHQELENYATTVIIDIACSLFLWTSGKYHFDAIQNVDSFIPAGISLPVENIVMEAMRRIDEWRRMKTVISDDSVFVQTGNVPEFDTHTSPLDDPLYYCYQQVNGISPVKSLLDNTFITEYKLYECLYSLEQSNLIKPLNDSLMRSVHAALSRTDSNKKAPAFLPVLVAAGAILIVVLIALFFRFSLLGDLATSSILKKNELSFSRAEHAIRNNFQYEALHSRTTTQTSQSPNRINVISKKCLSILQKKQKLTSITTEQHQ